MIKYFLLGILIFIIGCANVPQDTSDDISKDVGCVSNSDCGVGGCSGQICGEKEDVQGIITTCEFREIYGCYRLTSCGCLNNKCQWIENEEFNECVDKFS